MTLLSAIFPIALCLVTCIIATPTGFTTSDADIDSFNSKLDSILNQNIPAFEKIQKLGFESVSGRLIRLFKEADMGFKVLNETTTLFSKGTKYGVIAGYGGNGCVALVLAIYLARAGFDATVLLMPRADGSRGIRGLIQGAASDSAFDSIENFIRNQTDMIDAGNKKGFLKTKIKLITIVDKEDDKNAEVNKFRAILNTKPDLNPNKYIVVTDVQKVALEGILTLKLQEFALEPFSVVFEGQSGSGFVASAGSHLAYPLFHFLNKFKKGVSTTIVSVDYPLGWTKNGFHLTENEDEFYVPNLMLINFVRESINAKFNCSSSPKYAQFQLQDVKIYLSPWTQDQLKSINVKPTDMMAPTIDYKPLFQNVASYYGLLQPMTPEMASLWVAPEPTEPSKGKDQGRDKYVDLETFWYRILALFW